jgi:hypothetical protein
MGLVVFADVVHDNGVGRSVVKGVDKKRVTFGMFDAGAGGSLVVVVTPAAVEKSDGRTGSP